MGLLYVLPANAQMIVERKFNVTGTKTVEMKLAIANSIVIQTWDKPEVSFRASVNINDNRDNDIYLTSFSEDKDKIVAEAELNTNNYKGNREIYSETQIIWEVFIPENTVFSVETINGNVTITGETNKMNVKSISGFIDLSLSPGKAADIHFSTISGSIYSDFSLKLSGSRTGIPAIINESINDGGPLIRLETISGDIFFRKAV